MSSNSASNSMQWNFYIHVSDYESGILPGGSKNDSQSTSCHRETVSRKCKFGTKGTYVTGLCVVTANLTVIIPPNLEELLVYNYWNHNWFVN